MTMATAQSLVSEATPISQVDGRGSLSTAQHLASARQAAADEVEALVAELEPRLGPAEQRLLHQLRLAAETLGGVRAVSDLLLTRY